MPPTVLKLPKRVDTAAAVAATTMEVMMTILVRKLKSYKLACLVGDLRGMAEREECSYGDWFLAACKKSASHQIDGLYRTCKSDAPVGLR